jgi:nicotinamide phosphoribosyltransferase
MVSPRSQNRQSCRATATDLSLRRRNTRCHFVSNQHDVSNPRAQSITNYVETRLSEMWYPITVATLSHACRKVILKYLVKTGTPADIAYKRVDFGYRGVSSEESAMLGGLAHLVNFKASETIAAVVGAQKYYVEPMAATTIPAAEHSTITSWGREHEVDAFRIR